MICACRHRRQMPRRPPRGLRFRQPDLRSRGAISTLLISTCPGPSACTSLHTYLFVDGLDMVSRSDSRAAGLHPRWLLRPGGPLYPTDAARQVSVATQHRPEAGPASLGIGVRLQGEIVVWTDLMYPGFDGRAIEEVHFHLGQYVAEIERAYAQWGQLDSVEQNSSEVQEPPRPQSTAVALVLDGWPSTPTTSSRVVRIEGPTPMGKAGSDGA